MERFWEVGRVFMMEEGMEKWISKEGYETVDHMIIDDVIISTTGHKSSKRMMTCVRLIGGIQGSMLNKLEKVTSER
jgi:hypothetical protein